MSDLSPQVIRQYLSRIAWRRQMMMEQRGAFHEKYPETPLGAFLAPGVNFFDKQISMTRYREVLNFEPFMTMSNGEGKLYFQRNPVKRYLVGADVATGRQVTSEDTDYCAATVIELVTGDQVASYMARVTPEQFAYDLNDLGTYYNNATMAIERTGDGATTILVLKNECNYANIYAHKEWSVRSKQPTLVEGFPTTTKTRPIALNKLNWHLLQHPECFWDATFLGQALTFVRNDKGKPEAMPGAHDDTVSANWIAHGVRNVLLGYWDPLSKHREAYTNADQLNEEVLTGTEE